MILEIELTSFFALNCLKNMINNIIKMNCRDDKIVDTNQVLLPTSKYNS